MEKKISIQKDENWAGDNLTIISCNSCQRRKLTLKRIKSDNSDYSSLFLLNRIVKCIIREELQGQEVTQGFVFFCAFAVKNLASN